MSATQTVATDLASRIDNFSARVSEFTALIRLILPYIKLAFSGLQAIFNFILSLVLSLFRPIFYLSPFPALLYALAPVIVFLDIVATVFVRTPYRVVTYLLEALFPLYVFCGVACITGALLGIAARVLSRVIVAAVTLDENPSDSDLPNDTQPEEEIKPDIKGKGRRHDRVKVEF